MYMSITSGIRNNGVKAPYPFSNRSRTFIAKSMFSAFGLTLIKPRAYLIAVSSFSPEPSFSATKSRGNAMSQSGTSSMT
jgi:hypothetical protein